MRVKILKRSFAGAEFAPDVRVLKVGGQSSAGVEKLEFELPAEWQIGATEKIRFTFNFKIRTKLYAPALQRFLLAVR